MKFCLATVSYHSTNQYAKKTKAKKSMKKLKNRKENEQTTLEVQPNINILTLDNLIPLGYLFKTVLKSIFNEYLLI
ncbi:MAG: hypothetical protein A2X02_09190 [Bacteroidetes bacterium GWF2_29_10]|nr:MAG: hypothetical protein A2X02_09190 [Bacteroidetes bacterium GWF2_29_10]